MEWDSQTGDDGAQIFLNYPSGGYIYINLKDTHGNGHQMTAAGLTSANMQHIAFSYDPSSGNGIIYLNGTAVITNYLGNFTPLTSYDLYLGARHTSVTPTYLYAGLLDEISIYNRALAGNEIQGIYIASIFGKCDGNNTITYPQISAQPTDVTTIVGANPQLAVGMVGCSYNYQWYFNNLVVPGATNQVLIITNIQPSLTGAYFVVVSNAAGVITSGIANVTLNSNCYSFSSGLVGWWGAENNASDTAGINPGTLQNGLGFGVGEIGLGFNFLDTNGYVAIPASTSLNVGGYGSGLTLECWILPTDIASQHTLWNWNDGTNAGVEFDISVPNFGGIGSLYVNVVDVNKNSHVMQTAAGVINTNGYQHVAFTYDKISGLGKIFYNGTVVAQQSLGTFVPLTSLPLNLGKRISLNPAAVYKGLLDEMTLYSSALTPAAIQTIYLNGNQGKTCEAPQFVTQPQSQSVTVGSNATLTASLKGGLPMGFQWLLNGFPITNATNNTITVTSGQTSGAGNYSLMASNASGSVVSSIASLFINSTIINVNGQKVTNNFVTVPVSALVSIQNLFTNGYLFYTLDGSVPTFQSQYYNGSFTLTQSATLRLLDYSFDFSQSAYSAPLNIAVVPAYTLILSNSPGGSIVASPLAASYASNTTVALTAIASNGWVFLQWLGDVSGQVTSNIITLNKNKGVKALFGTALTTSVAGNGTLSLNPSGGFYPYGTTVQISAIPQTNYCFAIWGEAAAGSKNPLLFVVTNANSIVASLFAPLTSNQVSLSVVPIGHGQVSISPTSNIFNLGQTVSITATPDSGKLFTGWTGDASGTQNPLSITLNRSKTVYANFNLNSNLSTKLGAGGLNDGFEVDINGEVGTVYRLDASANMANWTTLILFTNRVGVFRYVDSTATNYNHRFYRAVVTQ